MLKAQNGQHPQNIEYDPNADYLSSLPTNQSNPSHDELTVVNSIFSDSNKDNVKSLVVEFKGDLLLGLLFFLLSLCPVDNFLFKYLPVTQKYPPYILLIVKSFIFVMLSWLSKNLWIIKKK